MCPAVRGGALASVVIGNTASSAGSFALWLGTYSGAKCSIQALRGRKDQFNSFGAGFLAGAVGTVRMRSARIMLMSGIGSGFLMALLESI
jgi:hypothetical protein